VVISLVALIGGMILALRAGGSTLSAQGIIWMFVAVVWFFPTTDSLWHGNVEGLQVLLIALTLTASSQLRGAGIVAHAWLKIVPVFLVPALLIREGKKGVLWLFVGSAILVLPAFAVAPAGFWQLPQVLVNISGAGSVLPPNLSPSSWLVLFANSKEIGDIARIASILAAIGLIGLSMWSSRRPEGWSAAVFAGICAGLILPGTIWGHYFLMLMPFGAYAWPRLAHKERISLLRAGSLVSIGSFMSLFVVLGNGALAAAMIFLAATSFAFIILRGLWPKDISVDKQELGVSQALARKS